MTDGAKILAGFIGVICGIVALIIWMDRIVAAEYWWTMVCCASTAVFCFALCFIPRPKDAAPDYLFERLNDSPLEKNDLCFTFAVSADRGGYDIQLWFQNQYDSSCEVAIQLSDMGNLLPDDQKSLGFCFQCPPGGFGIARVPLSVDDCAGARAKFRVGASVERRNGYGRRVRFRQGAFVRTEASLGSGFETGVQILGLLTGTLVTNSKTTVEFRIPRLDPRRTPPELEPDVEILWEIGDPPLGDSFVRAA